MLNLDKKIGLLLLCFFLTYCEEKTTQKEEISADVLAEYQKQFFRSYEHLYTEIKDSVQGWIHDSLLISLPYQVHPYQVDSIISFNEDSTRIFTTLNCRTEGYTNARSDDIQELGGAKIEGRWYFLMGNNWPIVRENYHEDAFAPLSFKELRAIAHKEIFPNYEMDPIKNEWRFDKAFFKAKFYDAFPECKTATDQGHCYDSTWKAKWQNQKTRKLDPVELESIKKEIKGGLIPFTQ